MPTAMTLDVYPTAGEAFDAAAARAAECLRAAPAGRPLTVALSGGRGGRAVMLALAARADVPWERVRWFWGDERCVPPADAESNVRLAREALLGPRGIPDAHVYVPPVEIGDPERIAAVYAETLAALVAGTPPALDLVLLGVGRNGHVASLMPGCRALHATAPVAAVAVEEVTERPRVARITLTPPVLRAAAHVVVAVSGDDKAAPVAAAMRGPLEPERVPAQLVRPSERIAWMIDRAAAAELLRDASPADQ
jgi:6-phosphogluconolactonase